MIFKYFLFFSFIENNIAMWANNIIDNKLSRRSMVSIQSIITTIPPKLFNNLSASLNNMDINSDDPYAHWSFFELTPPPIKKTIIKEELIQFINNNSIFSLQIAIQHNCVIATTKEGYRYACLISDNQFTKLVENYIGKGGQMPFYVLPIDPIRTKVRNFAQFFFSIFTIGYVAADLDLIDIDTSTYSSIKERNEAQKSNKKPTKFLKSLLESLFNTTKS